MHLRALFLYGLLSLGVLVAGRAEAQSCVGNCGGPSTSGACFCDPGCSTFGDCCPDYGPVCVLPRVTSISPANTNTTGGPITVSGTLFGATAGSVTVGTYGCAVSNWADTSITCILAPGVGTNLTVSVRTSDGNTGSRASAFSYNAPSISSVSPVSVGTAGGTAVNLTGSNFGASGAQVTVGGTSATVTSQTHTSLQFTAPAGEGTVQAVRVTVGGQSTNTTLSRTPPTILSLVPSLLPYAGTALTLTGANFGLTPTVKVGGLDCPVTSNTHTQVVCTSPGAASASVGLVLTAGSQASNTFTATALAPVLTGLTPSNGPTAGGTTLTLSGQGLASVTPTVSLGGVNCPVLNATNGIIRCVSPAGVGTGLSVVATVGAQSTNALTWTYDAPTLSTVSPSTGPTAGGTTLTLTGNNFGASAVGLSVSVGGNSCPVTQLSHTSLQCTLPAGAGTVAVVVSRGAQQSNAGSFSYGAPLITSLSPSSPGTQGGTTLTISGNNFGASGAAVTIDGVTCPVTSSTHTQVLCTLAPGNGGTSTVNLTTPADPVGASASLVWAPASVSSLSPASGPAGGGNTLTLSGTNFGLMTRTVTVGGASCPVSAQSHSSIRCQVPSGTGTAAVVLQPGAVSGGTYVYAPPSLTSFSPANGPTAGGYVVTLNGASLTGATLSVAGASVPFATLQDNRGTFLMPAGQGSVSLVVTRGGQSASVSFTYEAPVLAALTPTSLPWRGGALTLSGTNFGTSPTVTVGGQPVSVSTSTHTQAVVTVPQSSGLVTGDSVQLTAGGSQSNVVTLGYDEVTLSGLSPSHGPTSGGTAVTLTGTSLDRPGLSVTVGGESCAQLASPSATQWVCSTSPGVGTAAVVVARGAVTVSAGTFTYDAPVLTSLTPVDASTAGGTLLTLQGNNFGASGTVTVGGVSASPVSGGWSHTQVVVTLPPGAGGTVPVVLSRNGEAAQTTYHYAAPALSGLTPSTGPTAGGTSVTLSGSSLGTSGTVTIGGRSAPVTSWSHTHVVVTTPAGVGANVPVVLTRAGETAQTTFTYQAPVISSLSPAGAPTAGGTVLTVSGANFGSSGTATIGGVEVTVGTWSDGAVTVTLPPGAGGTVPVVLTRDGESASSSYTYGAPQVTALSPSGGSTAGGVLLTLTGSNFGDGTATTVTLGGAACTGVTRTHTQLTCTLPEGQGTAQAVVVTVAGVSATSSYDYGAPVLASLTPTQLPAVGGALRVTGSNFGLTPTVTVGGNACPVTAHDHQQVTCTAPAGTGTQPVVLTVGGQLSGSLSVRYTPSITVTSFFPGTAPARGGTVLLLEGTGLSQATVSISGASCVVLKASDTSVACSLPATPPGPATVTATSSAGTASLPGLEFVATCGVDLTDGASCDDGNPCTGPGRCAGTLCVNGTGANEGATCDDGNACTGSGACANGVCVASAANTGAACVDTAPCTGVGTCAAGVCSQATPAREGLSCGPVSGSTCVAGGCVAPPDAGVDGGEPDAGALDGGEVDGGEEHAGALDAGHVQDGGASDAGPLEDAGEAVDAGTGGSGGTGCGCTSTPGALWLGLLAVLAGRRRGAGPVRVGVTRR